MIDALFLVLGIPLVGAAVLGLAGHRDFARDINAAFSLGTLIAAGALTARVISEGPIFAYLAEEVVAKANEATRKLDEAERRIEMLVRNADGSEEAVPFDPEGGKGP